MGRLRNTLRLNWKDSETLLDSTGKTQNTVWPLTFLCIAENMTKCLIHCCLMGGIRDPGKKVELGLRLGHNRSETSRCERIF
jgi:hypothetical protein